MFKAITPAAERLTGANSAPEHDARDNMMREVRAYRLSRVLEQLRLHRCPAILLYDPVNIRYATDTSNMQVWAAWTRSAKPGCKSTGSYCWTGRR